jgi:hypothetical protein
MNLIYYYYKNAVNSVSNTGGSGIVIIAFLTDTLKILIQ